MKSFSPSYPLFALALAMTSTVSFGASFALDDASDPTYDSGWTSGQISGLGFGAWELTPGPANSGFFTGSSSDNGTAPSGDIDTAGRSWGLFANSGETASAVRRFTTGGLNASSALGVGQTFTLSFDNGFIDNGDGQTVGFGLLDVGNIPLFELYFVGGQAFYTVSGSANQLTDHFFTADGLTAAFTLTAADAYSLELTFADASSETFTGNLKGDPGSEIDRVRVFNANAGNGASHNTYANKMSIIPEPTSLALLSISAGGLLLGRRRVKGV